MAIFNNQKVLENGLASKVASLFTVLNDDNPISVANEDSENIAAFVGSVLYNGQVKDATITESKRTVKSGALEAIRTVPRLMTMYGDAGVVSELEQQYLEGLEFARFAGGTGQETGDIEIRSPWFDLKAGLGNVVTETSFSKGFAKLNKVGTPYIVVNPNVATTADVKELTDLYPEAIISMPRWLITGNVEGLQDIKGFVTTTGAMTVSKLKEPILDKEEHAGSNSVTYRLTGEIHGIETFKYATAVIAKTATAAKALSK